MSNFELHFQNYPRPLAQEWGAKVEKEWQQYFTGLSQLCGEEAGNTGEGRTNIQVRNVWERIKEHDREVRNSTVRRSEER